MCTPPPNMGRFPADDECRRSAQSPVTKGPATQNKERQNKRKERHIDSVMQAGTVFLEKDVIEPDITSSLLIQAGDIEKNPGPSCGTCNKTIKKDTVPLSCKSCNTAFHCATFCSKESRTNIEKLKISGIEAWECTTCRGIDTDNSEQPKKFTKCKERFRKAATVSCIKCNNSFHKISCTDESRERIEYIVKNKLEWTCKSCRKGTADQQQEEQPEATRDEEQPEEQPEATRDEEQCHSCGECGRRFSRRIKPMKCTTCSTSYHKTTCTGETRWKLDKIIKENKTWSCRKCRDGDTTTTKTTTNDNITTEEPEESTNTDQVVPLKCSANCGSLIRKGTDFLICSKCTHHFHKQQKCSNMSRKQVESLNRNTWECLSCQEIENNPETREEQEQETNYKIRRTKMEKMNILQYNIDTISSKLEELKLLLKEEVQETKMIKKDKDPKIPGYSILRKDRTQSLVNEENRGGGLIIGIRHDTPFKEIKQDISTPNDKHTESMGVEIPTAPHKKIRLTNTYIPPPNTSSGNVDENNTCTDNWPSKNHDILLGDFNAHSLIWDDTNRNNNTDTRGKKIEDWLSETEMSCLNAGTPTYVNRSTGKQSAPYTSFIHSSLLDKVTWKSLDQLGSDHKPIIITYEDQLTKVNSKPRYKWKLSSADWAKYSAEIEDKIPKEYATMKVNKLERKLRKAMQAAAKKHIGKKKITENTKPWLTEEIKEAIKNRN